MRAETLTIQYQIYDAMSDLSDHHRNLLEAARAATGQAYAPYSNFHVGAAVYADANQIMTGTNQENASFPVGICAERVLLSALACLPVLPKVELMAISYNSILMESNLPLSPCGMCRQALAEFETRQGMPLQLLLAGMEGPIWHFQRIGDLLPFAFQGKHLIRP